MTEVARSVIGMAALAMIAYALPMNRRAIRFRVSRRVRCRTS